MAEELNEKKKRFKFADAPHWISMIFSTAALVVSGLSWQESHRSRLINQSSNRALTYVIDVQAVPKPESSPEIEAILQSRADIPYFSSDFIIVIKNIGRTPAKNIRCHYTVIEKESEGSEDAAHEFEEGIKNAHSILEELLPGVQEEVIISIPWKEGDIVSLNEDGERIIHSIENYFLVGRLVYQDEPTEEIYEYNWCFQLGEGTTESPIKPCPRNYPKHRIVLKEQ